MSEMRSPSTGLSAAEVNCMRRVANGLARFLPSAHRKRLTSLGLITLNGGGRLVLTQEGKLRLTEKEGGYGPERSCGRGAARSSSLGPETS